MSVITLTTDSGASEWYISIAKGRILQECKDANIIDIAHHIEAFNIVQAAFILKNSFVHFPEKTIHVIDVNSSDAADTRFLAIHYRGHYFIGADNGIFSMIFEEQPSAIVEINKNDVSAFPLKNIFAAVAAQLANGKSLEETGKSVHDFSRRSLLQPAVYDSSIRAMVLHIDAYENAFLNVSKELFEQAAKGRKATISFRRVTIPGISTSYHDVEEGDPVCFFNSFGLLEIAMNKWKAGSALGLKINDIVQIDFE